LRGEGATFLSDCDPHQLAIIWTVNAIGYIWNPPAQIHFGLFDRLSEQVGSIYVFWHYLPKLLVIWAANYHEFQSNLW
jgi:hypothetical protein